MWTIIIGVVCLIIGMLIGMLGMTMLIQGKLASLGVIFKNGTIERILACGGWFHYQDGIGFMPDVCQFLPSGSNEEKWRCTIQRAKTQGCIGDVFITNTKTGGKYHLHATKDDTACPCIDGIDCPDCVDCPDEEPCES